MKKELMVGFGRAKTTPAYPVPLGGFGNTERRMHESVADDVYATCVALTDAEGSTVLLFHLDLLLVKDDAVNKIREAIHAALGIANDRIMLCCTHTHAGPDMFRTQDMPVMAQYLDALTEKCVCAAKDAMSDRTDAQIYVASVKTRNLNFVKHYQYTEADGTVKYFGDNFGTQVLDETTRHITDADPTMHLVSFRRGGAKDIVMANWRAHPLLNGSAQKFMLSADFVGSFRSAMEQKSECLFTFYQGAAGNINTHSRIREEERTRDCAAYGEMLAQHALEGLAQAQPIPSGRIQTRQMSLVGHVDHSKDDMIDIATKLVDMWTETNDRLAVIEAARPYGIRSPYNATSIVRRYNMPQTAEMELNAIAIGPELSIVTVPGEMFDTLSVMTEKASPYAHTLTLGYCNAYRGYIPSKLGYEYTCYESDATWFAPGIGEQVSEAHLEMLRQLKQGTL